MAWYNTNWLYRKKISVNPQTMSSMAPLANYPVYVNLANLGSNFFANTKSDGSDIRITASDEVSEVPFELVYIDLINQVGELYFKASAISETLVTDFYIYFGNASASAYATNATYGRNNVWTNGFLAVWHLHENPSTSSHTLLDSTGNGWDLRANAATVTRNTTTKKIGQNSIQFAGGYLYTANSNTYSQPITHEAWFQTSATSNQTIFGNGQDIAFGRRNLLMYSGTQTQHTENGGDVRANSTIGINNWHYVGSLKAPAGGTGSVAIYNNGAFQTTTQISTPSTTAANSGALRLGANASGTELLTGFLDEARMQTVQRNQLWMSATYTNFNAPLSFYNIGILENVPPPPINLQSLTPAIGSTGNAANTNLILDFDQNVSVGTGNVTIEQIPNLNIGGTFQGDLAELMMLNTMTDSDRQKIEGYLAWKWFGGNNNLPSNHPYKLYAPRN